MARRKLIASGGRSKQSYGRCSGTPDVPHEEPLANAFGNRRHDGGRVALIVSQGIPSRTPLMVRPAADRSSDRWGQAWC